MKIKVACLVLTLAVLLFACKKEKLTDTLPGPEITKIVQFDTCDCSTAIDKAGTGEYIKANLNGVPVCFDQLPQMNDTFPNMLKYGVIKRDTGDQYYDNL